MFKKENRYVSRQVNENVPIQLQILMWSMIDSLKEKKKLDYLQIFRLKVKEDKVLSIQRKIRGWESKVSYRSWYGKYM